MTLVQTSLEAFEKGEFDGSFENYRQAIKGFLARNYFYSYTSYDISRELGISILNVRPRLTELEKDGIIRKDERRGREFSWRIK